jgi:2,4-dienoyl-CoA reductase-like NADH-dependent reductase (Old Yellow Enzyme family)
VSEVDSSTVSRSAASSAPLDALFTPLTIGSLILRNRFVMPAMQRMRAADGVPTADFVDWYGNRAAGGAALIISEGAAIDHPSATKSLRILRLEESMRSGWQACAEAVHQAGSRFLVQLFHEGAVRAEGQGPHPDAPTLSPSGLVTAGGVSGQAATCNELEAIKDAYVRGARLAERSGADGVEIHSAHGYLLHQFLWRATNVREDEYGGALIDNRIRFAREIVEAIRQVVRRDFLVSFRISQFAEADFEAKPIESPEELGALLSIMRRAGVDIFNISTRRLFLPEWPSRDAALGLAGWAKRLTDAKVIAVGSIGLSRDLYESIFSGPDQTAPDPHGFTDLQRRFAAGHFDLVAIGRGMFADADWVCKVASGRIAEINPWRKALLAHVLQHN